MALTGVVDVIARPGQTRAQMTLDLLVGVDTYDSNCGHCEGSAITDATVTARPSGGQPVPLALNSLGSYSGTLLGWSSEVVFSVHSSKGDGTYTVHTLEPFDVTVTQATDPSDPSTIWRTLHWIPKSPPDGSVVDICDAPGQCHS